MPGRVFLTLLGVGQMIAAATEPAILAVVLFGCGSIVLAVAWGAVTSTNELRKPNSRP